MKKLLLAAGILIISITASVSVYAQEDDENVLFVVEEEKVNLIQDQDDAVLEELPRDETDNEADEVIEPDAESEETLSPNESDPLKEEAVEDAAVLEEEAETKEDTAALEQEEKPNRAQAAAAQKSVLNGWREKSGNTYYYKNGSKLTGWQNINGRVFYFLKTGDAQRKGKMLKGFQSINGRTYYFKKTGSSGVKGAMFTGFQTIGGKRFFFKRTGAAGTKGRMLTGWQSIDGKRYYFKKTGKLGVKGYMFKGVCRISGKKYEFASDGHLIGEVTLAKVKIGSWKKTWDSAWNSTGGDGVEYTITWSQVSGATGYEVCFSSRDIDEEKSGKAWHVDSFNTSSRSYKTQFSSYPTHIKVKVRAYKKASGKTEYGPWSSEVSRKCEWPNTKSDPMEGFVNSIKGKYYAVLPVGSNKSNVIIASSNPARTEEKITSPTFTPYEWGYHYDIYVIDGNTVRWVGYKQSRMSCGPCFVYKNKLTTYGSRGGYDYLEISKSGYKDVHVASLPKDIKTASKTITLKRAK